MLILKLSDIMSTLLSSISKIILFYLLKKLIPVTTENILRIII